MRSISKHSKHSKWLLILIVLVGIILLIIAKNTSRLNTNTSKFTKENGIILEKLQASLFTAGNGNPYIIVSFNYLPLGTSAINTPIFYLLDYADVQAGQIDASGNPITDAYKHPDASTLIRQKYLATDNGTPVAPILSGLTQEGLATKGYINKDDNRLNASFNRTPKKQYYLGLAHQTETLSGWGNDQLQFVYSDFKYAVLTAPTIYKCSSDANSNQCVEDATGTYTDKASCDADCKYTKPWTVTVHNDTKYRDYYNAILVTAGTSTRETQNNELFEANGSHDFYVPVGGYLRIKTQSSILRERSITFQFNELVTDNRRRIYAGPYACSGGVGSQAICINIKYG